MNSQNLVKTSNIKQKHSLKVERWNHLSEGIKNTTIVNRFENKICDRKCSIITFTFRAAGVYQNLY